MQEFCTHPLAGMKLSVFVVLLLEFIASSQQQTCPLDIAVIVDRTGRIEAINPDPVNHPLANWIIIQNFLVQLAGKFTVGSVSEFAAVTYGSPTVTVFTLDKYTTTSAVTAQFQTLSYSVNGVPGGVSDLTTAFNQVATTIINQGSPGRRSGVPGICFLLTTYPPAVNRPTYTAARDALKAVCRVVILAIGSESDMARDYPATASSPSDYFRVDDFSYIPNNNSLLNAIYNDITSTCPTPSTTTTTTTIPPSTLPPPTGCSNNVDVVFVLDGSGSVDYPNFQLLKTFITNLILSMDIENGKVKVSFLTYSDNVNTQFTFSQYQTRSAAIAAVMAAPYVRGTTNTNTALNTVRTTLLTDPGRRSGTPAVVVLFTDGGANDMQAAVTESVNIRLTGVPVIVVSAGAFVAMNELYNLASYPYRSNVIIASNYLSLSTISQLVLGTICDNVNECSPNPCQNSGTCTNLYNTYTCSCPSGYAGKNCEKQCQNPADMMFAISSASSVQPDDFQKQIDAVQNLMLNVNLQDTRLAFAVYHDTTVTINVNLNSQTTYQKIFDAMSTAYSGGTTNLTAVLNVARTQVFTTANDRAVPNILVLFVSGPSQSPASTASEAILARQAPASISIIVLAIGSVVSINELNAVASFPTSSNIYLITDFNSITATLPSIIDAQCNNVDNCLSRPCQNGGTCVDIINGYTCSCPDQYTGTNCDRAGSGVLDIVFGIDTSGSIRNERYYAYTRNFILSVVNSLEISPTKTRVGVVRWSDISADVFHLNAYSTKQDVYWAISQIQYAPGAGGTNTASALQMIKDVTLTAGNGDRATAPNRVLLFTDGNSNINQTATIPAAVDLRISRSAYIIPFGVGDVNMWELFGLASYSSNYFIATTGSAMASFLTSYLSAMLDMNSCSSNPCQNSPSGCDNNVKQYFCRCSNIYAGPQCSNQCQKSLDIAFILDISGSGNWSEVFNMNIQFMRTLVGLLQFGSSSPTQVSVITFGDGAKVAFNLAAYNNLKDILTAMSFRLSTGMQALDTAFGLLNGVFSSGRQSVPNVAILITDSDTPPDYSTITQAANNAKNQQTAEIYAVVVGTGPDMGMINSTATDSNHIIRISSTADISTASTNLATKLCSQ